MAYCTKSDARNKTGFDGTNTATSLTDAILDEMIADADREIELITGRKFTAGGTQVIEWFGGRLNLFEEKNIILMLANYPVISVDSFEQWDSTSSSVSKTYATLSSSSISNGTLSNTDYNIDPATGRITFWTDSVPEGVGRLKVKYTYGYSTVPREIKELSACLTGIRACVFLAGGVYDGVNSYSLPETSMTKEVHTRLQNTIKMLREQADRLLDRIGRKKISLMATSGSIRYGTVTELST